MSLNWTEIRASQHRFEGSFRDGDENSYAPLFEQYLKLCYQVFTNEESAAECFKATHLSMDYDDTEGDEKHRTKWNAIWYAVAANSQELLGKINHSKAYIPAYEAFRKKQNILRKILGLSMQTGQNYTLYDHLHDGYCELEVAAIYREFSAFTKTNLAEIKECYDEENYNYPPEQWALFDAIADPENQQTLLPIALQRASSYIDGRKLSQHLRADLVAQIGSGDMLATGAGVAAHIRIALDAGLSVNVEDWLTPQQISFWGLKP